MTGHLLACAALFPASLLPAATIAAVLKRRAGGQQVPGAGPAPVPGNANPPARQRQLPAPAPGPRHHTGRLTFTIKSWACGCILMFDGDGRITGTYACGQPGLQDPDEWLKGLTQ